VKQSLPAAATETNPDRISHLLSDNPPHVKISRCPLYSTARHQHRLIDISRTTDVHFVLRFFCSTFRRACPRKIAVSNANHRNK